MIKNYAFPSEGFDSGMELRDYYAAKAMQAILTKYGFEQPDDVLAHYAYCIANAMIKEKNNDN